MSHLRSRCAHHNVIAELVVMTNVMQHRINIAGVASAADWTTSISLAISFSLTHATTSLLAFSPLTSRTYPASRYYREQSLECFSLSTTTKFSDLPIYQLWLHVCSLCRRFSRVFTKVGFSCAPYDYGSSLSCFWVRFCAFFLWKQVNKLRST